MGKRPKQNGDVYKTIYYGIDPRTFEVHSVTQTQSGRLTIWKNSMPFRHDRVIIGDATAEVSLVFHLIEVRSVPAWLDAGSSVTREQVEMRATELKTEKLLNGKVNYHAKAKLRRLPGVDDRGAEVGDGRLVDLVNQALTFNDPQRSLLTIGVDADEVEACPNGLLRIRDIVTISQRADFPKN